MENKKCISYGLEHEAGVIISRCYQCGKCTAGCVLAEEMDFPPSFLVRLNCGNCIARCPKEIDIPKIMDYLREQSRHRNCINKQSRPVVAFHSAFLQSVRYTGRLYEIGLVAGFKMRTFHMLQDVNLVPGMLKKGKLNLLPECIETRQKIKKIFSKTIDKKEK